MAINYCFGDIFNDNASKDECVNVPNMTWPVSTIRSRSEAKYRLAAGLVGASVHTSVACTGNEASVLELNGSLNGLGGGEVMVTSAVPSRKTSKPPSVAASMCCAGERVRWRLLGLDGPSSKSRSV